MLTKKWRSFRRFASVIGIGGALKWHIGPKLWSTFSIQPKHALYPLAIRGGSSDSGAFKQIYIEREYACLHDMSDVGLIIDCGANVGYSSAYFLSQFPRCQVIAVEPDPSNFAMLKRNLAAYGDRVKLVQAGVWSQPGSLVISKEEYRDGKEWSRTVRPCHPGEKAELEGVAIGTLLADSKQERISLLKVDVEGAEAVIFHENFKAWLDKVDNIAIELHEDSTFGNANEVFFSAIEERDFEISTSGELTICRRRAMKTG